MISVVGPLCSDDAVRLLADSKRTTQAMAIRSIDIFKLFQFLQLRTHDIRSQR